MKKAVRYTLRTIAVLGGLLLLAWLVLVGIVTFKKPVLLSRINTELKQRTGGEVTIENMDLSFFRHFPHITLRLSKLILHDSLWQQHHHDLLKVDNLDLRFSFLGSLFSGGKPRIDKIFLEHGAVYLFTDSTGYSNTAMLRSKDSTGTKAETKWPDFSLTDIRFVLEKQDKKKLFDLDIHHLNGKVEQDKRTLLLDLNTDIQVHSFAFNTEKGSYLKDKPISGHFQVQFNSRSKILQVNKQTLRIDGQPFLLSGRFFPSVSPDPFLLTIQTENIPFKKASGLLTP
ncbi:MAG: AsmA family protein, partial [Bacteroidota bacterium]